MFIVPSVIWMQDPVSWHYFEYRFGWINEQEAVRAILESCEYEGWNPLVAEQRLNQINKNWEDFDRIDDIAEHLILLADDRENWSPKPALNLMGRDIVKGSLMLESADEMDFEEEVIERISEEAKYIDFSNYPVIRVGD